MTKAMWIVRAGRGGELIERYREQGRVGLGQGGEALGPLAYTTLSKSDPQDRLRARFPAWKPGKVVNAAGQLHRIRGRAFTATTRNARVSFGNQPAKVIRFASDGELLVEAPGGAPGIATDILVVFEPGGELTLPAAFRYE